MLQRRWQSTLILLFFLILFSIVSSDLVPTNQFYSNCSVYLQCGDLSDVGIYFPFRLLQSPSYCGYPGYELSCNLDHEPEPELTLNLKGKDYAVHRIIHEEARLVVVDPDFMTPICPQKFTNTSINTALFNYTNIDRNLTVYYNCKFSDTPHGLIEIPCLGTHEYRSYYRIDVGPSAFLDNRAGECEFTAAMPVYGSPIDNSTTPTDNSTTQVDSIEAVLKEGFGLGWNYQLSEWCQGCRNSGGICGYNESRREYQTCFCRDGIRNSTCQLETAVNKRSKGLLIGLTVAGFGAAIICASICFILYYTNGKRKRRPSSSSSTFLDSIVSFKPFSKSDPELGHYLNAPIFRYEELYEATDGFDESRELGDGGFGTVYKGKLRDGRVVAVKRLYESNYRRVEQFMNEVKILSVLRHQNLVSLYGCTSRHSRELLLVYEFVPNGTVAEHLHGKSLLPWGVRMSIAIETAEALNYLHSVEPQIIHRDVKSSNILLDNGFGVKVADFGLSRLFPLDATHVSTAPQGTPGYVDPEYHQSYQLTDRSDVYSFGVVLMELISSKPAVDLGRQRNEINLASMALARIHNRDLHDFVDQTLGYRTDCAVRRMIDQVAELGFRCLHSDAEMRPCIREVLQDLTRIQNDSSAPAAAAAYKEGALPHSPNAVTDGWASAGTTPNPSQ